jgi:predicted phosphodiesterase
MTEAAELRRLRRHNAHLLRQLHRAQEDQIAFQEIRERIFGLATTPHTAAWPARKEAPAGTPGTPVLVLADWHAGEVVRREELGGINAYNRQIMVRRVHRVIETAIDIATHHVVNPRYQGIVVPILGDMVTGEIHDELARTNDTDPLPAVLLVADLLTEALRRLHAVFGRVYVPAVCGNHGRTDRKQPAKTFTPRNYDWLIYQMVERRLLDLGVKDVVIESSFANEVSFTIHGHRFMALHGHDLGVKGGDGIIGPLGPIMRGRIKVGAQQASIGRDFDTLLLGHWHGFYYVEGLLVTNTLKGYDEYAKNVLRAKPSRPSQSLFFVHPDHGISSVWQVYAEPKRRATTAPRSTKKETIW